MVLTIFGYHMVFFISNTRIGTCKAAAKEPSVLEKIQENRNFFSVIVTLILVSLGLMHSYICLACLNKVLTIQLGFLFGKTCHAHSKYENISF